MKSDFPILRIFSDITRSITASSAQSSAAPDGVEYMLLHATTDTHIAWNASPTATASNFMLPAGVPMYFKVSAGEKVAGIQNATNGTLYIAWMTR